MRHIQDDYAACFVYVEERLAVFRLFSVLIEEIDYQELDNLIGSNLKNELIKFKAVVVRYKR